MPSEIANPFSTGGGGFSFETSVQAGFLALMFVGGKCPCLHQGKIHTLRFQAKQAGYGIDDLLVIAADQEGTNHRLLIQSKHEIKFTKSNEAYVETIRAAWADFTNGEKFDRKNDSIAIVSGPHSAKVINHARPVLEWARFSESSEEFFSKVASEKFSSNSKKVFVADLRFILQDVLTPRESDDALWNFLKTLHLLSYDFDVTRGQDEARSLTLIEVSKGDHSDVSAEAIWADFLKVAREANVTAATLTRESVQKLLSEASKKAFPLTIGAGGESLGKLAAHSQHVLNRITNEFVKDVSLNRRQIITEAIDLAEQTQVLIITGDAGAGKSAIAKELVQRLERQEGIPVFAFRIEEFEAPHVDQALVAMGVFEGIDKISARFSMLPRKILFIDSVERLFELDNTDGFSDLLRIVKSDPTWRIILACRSQQIPHLHLLFSNIDIGISQLRVPLLSSEELTWVSERVPTIKPFLEDEQIRDVFKVPLYLRILCRFAPSLLAQNIRASNQIKFRKLLWHEAVAKPEIQAGGMPLRRTQTFISLAVRRAKSMRPYVSADGLDAEAIKQLENDDLLVTDGNYQYAPADDLFEDWALFEHIEKCFSNAGSNWSKFFEEVGPEPALRRTFRQWLSHTLADTMQHTARDLLSYATRDRAIPQFWRDELIVVGLSSESASSFISELGNALLEDKKSLLKRTIHLLRTACKGPNATFADYLSAARPKGVSEFLSLSFAAPAGNGWPAVIHFIDDHADQFGIAESALVLPALTEWINAMDKRVPLPESAKASARLALKYFLILTEENRFSGKLPKEALAALLQIPNALSAEVEKLYADYPPSKQRRVRSFPLDDELPPDWSPVSEERSQLLAKQTLRSLYIWQLAKYFPKQVMSTLDGVAWRKDQNDYGSADIQQYFGLANDYEFKYYPASSWQGPFLPLLISHPDMAVPFILNFVERACEFYVRSGIDGEVKSVTLRLANGETRTIFSSVRLWCLFRGTQVVPHIIESAFEALEQWLFAQVEANRDISQWVSYLLNNAKTVAPIAVLTSIALAHPQALGAEVLALVSTLDFFSRDYVRKQLDGQYIADIRSSMGIPKHGGLEDMFYDERVTANARPHRKKHLEDLALSLQSTAMQSKVHERIDLMKKEDLEGEGTVTERMILKRIDLRGYRIIRKTDEGLLIEPDIEDGDLKVAADQAGQQLQHMARGAKLMNWAIARWQHKPTNDFIDWRDAYQETIAIEALEVGDQRDLFHSTRVGAHVAALLVRDLRAELNEEQARWCVDKITDAILEDADTKNMTTQVGSYGIHGSRPAATVIPLLLDLPKVNVALVSKLLAMGLTHAVEEVRKYTAFGVREWLWDRNPNYVLRCVELFLEQAKIIRQISIEARTDWKSPDSYKEKALALRRATRKTLSKKSFSTAKPVKLPDIDIHEISLRDLLFAIGLLPVEAMKSPFDQMLNSVFGQLMDAESKAKPGKNREIDYGFRSEYTNLYAQFIFHSGAPLHAESSPLREIIKGITAAPKLSAMLLTKIFHCQDRHRNDERFWLVWRACALPLFNSPKILEWNHDAQELLRVLIFAQGYWKAGEKWPPLEDNLTFIRDALHYVGEVPAGFSMLVSTFRTVASSLLPDAIIELELQFKKIDKEQLITDENLKISLEWLLRDCIFSSSTLIRKRDVLRTAVITLLDFLVDAGRSLAFQMREMVISPIRNR